MGRPSLLILDEPIAGLDVVEYERLKSLLFCFRGAVEGSGYFCASLAAFFCADYE
ncbi:Uncharacterised protein [Arcanobacterium haemolyticum]|nr:Uncharacterised protein [Arcanobacterium haemolyticum]